MADESVRSWLTSFNSTLERRDIAAAVELFDEKECFWRDLLAFTWNIYSAESKDEIRAMLDATLDETKPSGWIVENELPEEFNGVTHAFIRFETQTARCRGHVRIRGHKCWTLLTTIEHLKGHEERAGSTRAFGVHLGAMRGRKTWLDEREQEMKELGFSKQPYCVIVGGGQAGIALGARLRQLGVPTIIVEKNTRPGDSWRNRYKSLCLHDPVSTHHFPYIPFPDHWPIFSPKDKLADWLEAYTKIMELVYWSSTECKSAKFDDEQEIWEVVVDRAGQELTLYPKQLVLATGVSGFPRIPNLPGLGTFKGVQCHSSRYKDGEVWEAKHCVVIGSNNSAHDICEDLWENGAAKVTMIQRSSTHVTRSETLLTEAMGYFDPRSSYCTADRDLLSASIPFKLFQRLQIPVFERVAKMDETFYEGLKKAGFLHDFGEDGSGLFVKYMRRASGYYIDVGASQLVIDGEIKLKSGVEVKEVKPRAVVLADDSEIEADLIVYATGYTSMSSWVAKLISQEVADRVGKCWGLGSETKMDPGPWERELRNMWKPTQQLGLWFHGGNLHQSRHYSLFLALQLKARMEGIRTPVYELSKVHHRA